MKTAVEWLEDEVDRIIETYDVDMMRCYLEEAYEQAKEMEKKQMIEFAKTLPIKTRLLQEGGTTYMRGDVELHYNETFKKQEQ
jgi:hypothetical protein